MIEQLKKDLPELLAEHLLSNALKFTPEGDRIVIRARALRRENGDRWADTGVGIGPEDHRWIHLEGRKVAT